MSGRMDRWRGVLGMSADSAPADLQRALDRLVDRLILVAVFLYPLVLAGYVYRVAVHGWRSNILLQAALYLLIIDAYRRRQRYSFRVRALVFVGAVFLLSAAGLYQWGLVGAGISSLFFTVVFASILLGFRHGFVVLVASVVFILAVGYGAVHGGLHQDLDVRLYVTSWSSWLAAAATFLITTLVTLIAFGTLYEELIRMFVAARERARELEESRTRLREETSQRQNLEAQFVQAQKMEAVGRLAGGVAHDFNNQLFVITSMAEMLERKLGPDSPHRRDLGVILQSARRSAELTRQLLAFSRKQAIQPRVMSLNEAVRGVESMLRRLIGENIQLRLELSPNPSPVNVDQGLLEQAIVNLAVNARDAMPRGGRLTLATSNRRFEETHTGLHGRVEPGSYVLLSVSDTGVGMSQRTLAHVFEPFFTTKDRDKGTGLGLSSVYGFVKQSGGEVLAESEEGAGATFTLCFPQFEMAGTRQDSRLESAQARGGHETILVVEDERDVRNLLSAMLEELGYRAILCGDAEEALRKHADALDGIALLITDLVLPGMTGRELADRFRSRKSDLQTVFISGYDEEVVSHLRALGEGVRFIQKPFDSQTLGRTVREALDAA